MKASTLCFVFVIIIQSDSLHVVRTGQLHHFDTRLVPLSTTECRHTFAEQVSRLNQKTNSVGLIICYVE
jgi:hypothetical protein